MLRWTVYSLVISTMLLAGCRRDTALNVEPTHSVTAITNPAPSSTIDAPTLDRTLTPTETLAPTSTVPPLTVFPTETPLALLKSGQIISLTNLQMTDEKNGWAIESTGHIVHTEDSGYTWQDVTPPTKANQSYSEAGFFALDAKTAWATPGEFVNCFVRKCGKTSIPTALIWRTTNGGKDWQPSQPIPTSIDSTDTAPSVQNYVPIRIQFIDSHTGWLMIDGTMLTEDTKRKTSGTILFHTINGGENWAVINDHRRDFNFPSGYSPDVPAIRGFTFTDAQTGWVVGQSDLSGMREFSVEDVISNGAIKLKKTVDGGRSFIDIPLLFPVDLSQPEYRERTMSCGAHQISPIAPNSISLQWSCANHTNPYTSYYLSSVSDDGGQTWQHWHSPWNEFFLNRQEGWRQFCVFVGQLCALESTVDGGRTWATLKEVYWSVWQLDFVNAKAGWAIVFLNDASGTRGLLRTSNGGEAWVEITPRVANKED